jgi:alpha-1,2-mannosyltransferase
VGDQGVTSGAFRPGGPVRRLAAALGVLLGLSSVFAHAMEYRGEERFSKDFAIDYGSALALRNGDDPYVPIKELVSRYLHAPPDVVEENVLPGGNWHPPFKIVTTIPLTFLPYRAAGVVWLLLCAACVVGAMVLLGRELGWRVRTSMVAGLSTLAIPVVQIDLSAGNVNGPLLLLLVATWRLVRRGTELRAGAALGTAAAVKLFPAFVGLPLLAAGRRRAVIMGAAVTVVLTAAGVLIAGASSGGDHLDALRSEGFSYWISSPANLSFWGLSTRWLGSNGWVDGAALDGLGTGIALVAAGAFALMAYRPQARASGDPFWAAIPLMLLAWPIVWNHYLVLAIPWVVLALRAALSSGPPPIALTIVCVLLMMGFPPGLTPIDRASELQVALGYQLPTFALLAAVALDRAPRSSDVTARVEPGGVAR